MGSDNINDAADAMDVSAVSDAIRAEYKLPELTDEQKQQRQLEMEVYRWEQHLRHEQQRLAYRQRQAEAEASAEQERRSAESEINRKARLRRAAEIDRQTKDRELKDLRLRVAKSEWWQGAVGRAYQNTRAYQSRQTLMNELENEIAASLARPEPEPEPPLSEEDEESFRRIWGR